jgi:tetratricopeptide (TPR) repeat protein
MTYWRHLVTALLGITICVIATACRREPVAKGTDARQDPNAGRGFSPAVPRLPDLSSLDPSLQEQLRSEYSTLERSTATGEQRADQFGRMGTLLLAAELPAAAESFFTQAHGFDERDMRWPYYLGHVYRATHQLDQAAAAFADSLRLDPDSVPALVWLADTELALGRPDAAESHLATAVQRDGSSAAAWFTRGRVAIARREFQAAIEYLQRAQSLAPDADAVHYPLGLAYRGIGDRTRAGQHMARRSASATLPPADPLMDGLPALLQTGSAHLTRGLDAMERRDWQAAVEHLRAASALAPRDGIVQLNLGTALFLSGDGPGARAALETAVRVAPELPKAHYALALVAEADGRDAEAIAHFTTAVRLDANYVEAHASLADALRRTGRVEQSLSHYSRVLAVDPSASQARFGYAMALIRLDRYREARDWLRQAADLHPDQPGFAHALARVLAAAPDAAVRNGRDALQLTEALLRSHQSPALAETMAMALAEAGHFAEAVRWQQNAIDAARAAGQPDIAARMQVNLARYRSNQPCRAPWAPDDPVHFPRPAT